ncbi:MAG: TerD family protein [Alphaproteobacteria bacterium]|nr:TerD family protein [Alphaproteobacteria bacterium]
MSDDENKKPEGIDKYGYDPLDDIKPIDIGDLTRKHKDDTFLDPVEITQEPKSRMEKAAPTSSLEKADNEKQKVDWQEYQDLVFKGDYFSLTERDPTLRQVVVGAGWEQKSFEKEPVDLDLSCFLLDKTDKTRHDNDFVFYNNPTGSDGAVKLLEDSRSGAGEGDDERIFIDLNGVPFEIIRIMFAISIYDQQLKGYSFDDVRDLYIRVVNYDDSNEIARFIVPEGDLSGYNGTFMAAMVREGPQWFLQPLAEGVKGSLSPIARKYGLIIAEESG